MSSTWGRDQFGAAEGAGKAQGKQCAAAQARQRLGWHVAEHLGEHVSGSGGVLLAGGAKRAADAVKGGSDQPVAFPIRRPVWVVIVMGGVVNRTPQKRRKSDPVL
jgi:hypothetical protein